MGADICYLVGHIIQYAYLFTKKKSYDEKLVRLRASGRSSVGYETDTTNETESETDKAAATEEQSEKFILSEIAKLDARRMDECWHLTKVCGDQSII